MTLALNLRAVLRSAAIFWLLSILAVGTSFAQSETATLSGTITDQSGALLPGVKVIVVDESTNSVRETITNDAGLYSVPSLRPGHYRMVVTKQSFKQVALRGLVLNVQDVVNRNFTMQVGGTSETVQVQASGMNINTTDGTIGTVIDRQFVGNLPLNGRSFQTLLMLNPGVVATSTANGPGEFSVNGQRTDTNYFTVDGVSANTGSSWAHFTQYAGGALPGNTALGTTSSLVPVDALEEFRVQTSTYSAEFGRQPGGQVQLVTRSGGNDFHGSAFEFLRNDVLDAQDWFNSQLKAQDPTFHKPALRMNDFGGTFSGPIIKNKTFFFFSYEGQRLRIPITTSIIAYVPTEATRNAASSVMKPFLSAFPLPNGPEVQVLENPYLSYDPDPSSPTYNPSVPSGFASLSGGYSNPSSVDTYSFRLDQSFGNRLKLFGRYSRTPSNNLERLGLPNQLVGTVSSNQTITVGTNLAFTNRLTDEFRANYSGSDSAGSTYLDNFGGATAITAAQMTAPYRGPGPVASNLDLGIGQWLPNFNDPSYYLGDVAKNRQRQWNVVDNLSWLKGRHVVRGGVDWRHLTPVLGPLAYGESIGIPVPNQQPNYSQFLNDIEMGSDVYVQLSTNRQVKPIYDDLSLFLDDTWKISSRLTLTPGLRWEINPAPHDANGVMPIMISGIQGTDTSGTTLAPAGTPFYKTDYAAFAPRIGAAYQLRQTNGWETVLRGGFGVFYDLGSELALSGFSTYPFQSTTTLFDVTLPLSSSLAQRPLFPADPSSVTLPLHHGTLWAFNPNLTLPYTLQWNIGIEQTLGNQQLITLSYVASAGRKLISSYNLNNIPSNSVFLVTDHNQYRENPNFDSILYGANGQSSDYDSFQAQYQRRLAHGLQALANYTWSHAIDDASYSGAGTIGVSGQFARGNADFDVRHNFSLALSYDFPSASSSGRALKERLLSAVTGGWSMDTIFLARTGLPLDVIAARETLANGMAATIRPNVVPGQPMWIADPGAPGGEQLNVSAFSIPAYTVIYPFPNNPKRTINFYQQGDLGRNTIRVPGIYQLNMALGRKFNITERTKLQAKIEAFNVFNHPMFGTYNSIWSPTTKTFGLPTQMLSTQYSGDLNAGTNALNSLFQNGGPRSVQLSLKVSF